MSTAPDPLGALLEGAVPQKKVVDFLGDDFIEAPPVSTPPAAPAPPVAPPVVPAPAPASASPPPAKFRRVIDLGDGSGKQIFEADTADGLVDALAKAQENATRKIQELSRRRRYARSPDTQPLVEAPADIVPASLSGDQAYLASQDPAKYADQILLSSPMACRILNDAQRAAYRQKLDEAETRAAQEFVGTHEDYLPCAENWTAINSYLISRKWPVTPTNLEIAFEELQTSGGLLEAASEQTPAPPQDTSRIASPAPTTPESRPVATGLSDESHQAHLGQPQPAAQVAAEIAGLPLEQARQRILAYMYKARNPNSQ